MILVGIDPDINSAEWLQICKSRQHSGREPYGYCLSCMVRYPGYCHEMMRFTAEEWQVD